MNWLERKIVQLFTRIPGLNIFDGYKTYILVFMATLFVGDIFTDKLAELLPNVGIILTVDVWVDETIGKVTPWIELVGVPMGALVAWYNKIKGRI